MGIFSNVLLTVDYDRTLTGTDGTIPERNLEAIRFFMKNGGAFTVNTGRSLAMARAFAEKVPINAPLLLFNGGAAYDLAAEQFTFQHPITLEQGPTIRKVMEICAEAFTEIQGVTAHYVFKDMPQYHRIYDALHCPNARALPEDDMGPFIKIGAFYMEGESLQGVFASSPEMTARFDRYEAELKETFGDSLTIVRSTPVTLDIQASGVSKGLAARELAQQMGRTMLVCVGDERNDVSMLDLADYAFCPSDGKIASYYNNVCSCSEGAAADVIYKKIPEILGISLDNL